MKKKWIIFYLSLIPAFDVKAFVPLKDKEFFDDFFVFLELRLNSGSVLLGMDEAIKRDWSGSESDISLEKLTFLLRFCESDIILLYFLTSVQDWRGYTAFLQQILMNYI